MDPEQREAAARAIVQRARQGRPPTSRWLLGLALAVGLICVGALGIALYEGRSAPARDLRHGSGHGPARGALASEGGGFGVGLALGLAGGIAIGVALGSVRRDQRPR